MKLELNSPTDFLNKAYLKQPPARSELEVMIAARQSTIYSNAFEWRFEFPEVLDKDGNFDGFDEEEQSLVEGTRKPYHPPTPKTLPSPAPPKIGGELSSEALKAPSFLSRRGVGVVAFYQI
jgi:hypothetical protein